MVLCAFLLKWVSHPPMQTFSVSLGNSKFHVHLESVIASMSLWHLLLTFPTSNLTDLIFNKLTVNEEKDGNLLQ